MLIEFFVLGSVAFWALVALAVFFGFVCAAWDSTWELTVVVLTLTALALVLAGDLLSYITMTTLLWIPAWLGIGLVWSLPRWVLFLRKGKRSFDKIIANTKYDLTTEVSRRKFVNLSSCLSSQQEWGFEYEVETGKLLPPVAKAQAGRITTWILLWPWSLIWTAVGDGLVEVTRWVVEWLSGLYQRIADYIYE